MTAIIHDLERHAPTRRISPEADARIGRLVAATRKLGDRVPCCRCGEAYPIRQMSNLGVGHAPRWTCVTCQWPNGGN